MDRVTWLYRCELLGGIYVLFQGVCGVILNDKIKSQKLIKFMLKIFKLSLLFYLMQIGLRTMLFFWVHSQIVIVDKTNKHDSEDWFGSFFGEAIGSSIGSKVMTIILITIYTTFYLSLCFCIKYLKKLQVFLIAQADQEKIDTTILINNQRSGLSAQTNKYNYDGSL